MLPLVCRVGPPALITLATNKPSKKRGSTRRAQGQHPGVGYYLCAAVTAALRIQRGLRRCTFRVVLLWGEARAPRASFNRAPINSRPSAESAAATASRMQVHATVPGVASQLALLLLPSRTGIREAGGGGGPCVPSAATAASVLWVGAFEGKCFSLVLQTWFRCCFLAPLISLGFRV